MEKRNNGTKVKSDINIGGLKLPIGYRFRPTDEEVVVHYLKRKVIDVPFPSLVIPRFDVFLTHPLYLPGDVKQKRYFFSQKIGTERNKCEGVGDGSGYWKNVGKDKQIVSCFDNKLVVVGIRRTLGFHQSKSSNLSHKSPMTHQWVMHEFSLFDSQEIQMSKPEWGEWVIYRVFQRRKKRPSKASTNIKKTQTLEVNSPSRPSIIDFSKEESFEDIMGPPALPCSPCSSEITHETSSNCYGLELDHEEISSSF